MSDQPGYTLYHPRWYRPRMSTWWWLQRGSYLMFILREVSSVFIAWFVVFTLMQIRAVNAGGESYKAFVAWCQHPAVLILNIITLGFVLLHSCTWFNLAPKAMVMRMGGKQVPPKWIVASNYAAWGVVSVIVVWLIYGA
jgi:fumarate reductase subunit C